MQRTLTERGLYDDKIDGKAGMLTRAALGAYQKANGLKLDCWPTADVLAAHAAAQMKTRRRFRVRRAGIQILRSSDQYAGQKNRGRLQPTTLPYGSRTGRRAQ